MLFRFLLSLFLFTAPLGLSLEALASDVTNSANAKKSATRLAGQSATRLAGQTAKKLGLALTLGFVAYDANAAYEEHCSHLMTDEEVTACTTEHFIADQAEDLSQMAEDARITWQYIVVPEAEEYWAENGDNIKQGASDALQAVGRGIVFLHGWLTSE